jgi:hypothetical protein
MAGSLSLSSDCHVVAGSIDGEGVWILKGSLFALAELYRATW